MGSSKKVTVGFKYYIGVHFVLCHGELDKVISIYVSDKLAYTCHIVEVSQSNSIYVNNENLFGGKKREGGILGYVDVVTGNLTHSINSYLSSRIGGLVPAFRGVASIILNQVYIGTNPFIKNWSFVCKRISKKSDGAEQWNVTKSAIFYGGYHIKKQFYFISIDNSNSMDGNQMNVTKLNVIDFLTKLIDFKSQYPSFYVDVNILFWNSSLKNVYLKEDFNASDLSDAIDWVNASGSPYSADIDDSLYQLSDLLDERDDDLIWDKNFLLFIDSGAGDPTNIILTLNTFPTLKRHLYKVEFSSIEPVDAIDNTSNSESLYFVNPASIDWPESIRIVSDDIFSQLIIYHDSHYEDMNPSHIIRECLTDKIWGMGYNDEDIDDTSFEQSADTLHTEKFGLSIRWTREQSIDEFINLILSHVEGTLYVSRETGKFVLKLARADYDIDSLIELNETNISSISGFKRKTVSELTNQVTVVYEDNATGKKSSVTVQNLALLQQQGVVISQSFNFMGISNTSNANKVAYRELKSVSSPLFSCSLYTNRISASLNVGDVFKLSWAKFGILNAVMRVSSIELGDITNNLIKVDCVQDVFGVNDIVIQSPTETGWVNPITEPVEIAYAIVIETPYYLIARNLGDTDAQSLPIGAGYFMATGVSPTNASYNFDIYTLDTEWTYGGVGDFCPSAVIYSDLTIDSTSITVENTTKVDFDLVVTGDLALINDEFITIDSIVTGPTYTTLTLGRGCLDTVRKLHLTGSRIYVVDYYAGSDEIEYTDGETIDVRLLTNNSLGTLAIEDASTISVTMDGRKDRPYPPAKVQVNGVSYPSSIDEGEDLVLTWVHRNRLSLTNTDIINDLEDGVTPEVGTLYDVEIYDSSDTLITSVTDINDVTTTITSATLALNFGIITIKLWSHIGSVLSWQSHEFTINRIDI